MYVYVNVQDILVCVCCRMLLASDWNGQILIDPARGAENPWRIITYAIILQSQVKECHPTQSRPLVLA